MEIKSGRSERYRETERQREEEEEEKERKKVRKTDSERICV